MSKTQIVKTVASYVVGTGTTSIVHGIVRSNTQPSNAADQVAITSAAVVIGMMAAKKTRAYTDSLVDETAEFFQNLKSNHKKTN